MDAVLTTAVQDSFEALYALPVPNMPASLFGPSATVHVRTLANVYFNGPFPAACAWCHAPFGSRCFWMRTCKRRSFCMTPLHHTGAASLPHATHASVMLPVLTVAFGHHCGTPQVQFVLR